MIPVYIVETNLTFTNRLTERASTEYLVIHHTGSIKDVDFSAEKIHEMHIKQNHWAGIGYHFVIRKNGIIERGRPIWAIGAHAGGHNSNSIGIHVCGDFNTSQPTAQQIESTAMLIANLCETYSIPIDRQHIKGHYELDDPYDDGLGCPGRNLFKRLGEIVNKANWYCNTTKDVIDVPKTFDGNIEDIAILTKKYESNGDPACVANNAGDLGGMSYGLYQFSSNAGTVEDFVKWLCNYEDAALANYGKVLAAYKINSDDFVKQWKELGNIDPGNFGKLQDEYIKLRYYDVAAEKLARKHFNVNKHTNALKSVVLARAIQNGVSGCVELFDIACEKLGYPNLSYVDDSYFDGDLINAIYDYLIVECDLAEPDSTGVWRSPDDFCHGSKSIIISLRHRFVRERVDALEILTGGLDFGR